MRSWRALFFSLLMSACCGEGGCPDTIYACKQACGEAGMVSFNAKDGCKCNAPDGGSR
jgi:hypothetical protein